jgi:hypothetical protein
VLAGAKVYQNKIYQKAVFYEKTKMGYKKRKR